jgi:release factor glutamine methyltransferase
MAGARIEVQSLLRQVLNVSRAYLLAYPERCLSTLEQAQYEALLLRRLHGEPIAYLLGEREFFGLMFKVTPATLIPRPETELLVEQALQRIAERAPSRVEQGEKDTFRLLDLGTGSGAIALAIAHTRPDIEVVAVDASVDALAVARENAHLLDLANVTFIQSDWFAGLPQQSFDMIVSNPPYVFENDPHLQQGDLRFEPRSALASGYDGLDDIRKIVAGTSCHLRAGGWLLLEHGYDQAEKVCNMMREAGLFEIYSANDLSGIQRVSAGCAPSGATKSA